VHLGKGLDCLQFHEEPPANDEVHAACADLYPFVSDVDRHLPLERD
jgi:hypothetical protein